MNSKLSNYLVNIPWIKKASSEYPEFEGDMLEYLKNRGNFRGKTDFIKFLVETGRPNIYNLSPQTRSKRGNADQKIILSDTLLETIIQEIEDLEIRLGVLRSARDELTDLYRKIDSIEKTVLSSTKTAQKKTLIQEAPLTTTPPPKTPQEAPQAPRKRKKNYLNSEDMMQEIIISQSTGKLTEKLGEMFLLLAKKYISKPSWKGYTFTEDMQGDAVLACVRAVPLYNCEFKNTFAYFTQIMKNCFIQNIKRFNKQQKIQQAVYDSALPFLPQEVQKYDYDNTLWGDINEPVPGEGNLSEHLSLF